MIEAAFYHYLSNTSAITSVVGTRIYNSVVDQNNSTYPVLVYTLVASTYNYHLKGVAGIASARFQIDAYGTTLASCLALSEAVKGKLNGYQGTMNSVSVPFVNIEMELGAHDWETDGKNVPLWRKTTDYVVKYKL